MLFFHVGLHKTGTTFLQQAVYPNWQGISYVPWPDLEVVLRLNAGETHLISREGLSGKNWAHHDVRERSLRRLSELFPDSRILISFRKHSSYILSSYRQYLQRGGALSFSEYFDVRLDSGFMKRDDFLFRKKIDVIERYFRHTPFVFLHNELRDGMKTLLTDMEGYIGGRAPKLEEITNRSYNKSVGYYSAKLLRRLNRVTKSELNPEGRYNLNHSILRTLKLTPKAICQHWLSFLPSPPFLTESETTAIDDFYREDWKFVQAYASGRRDKAGQKVSEIVSDM